MLAKDLRAVPSTWIRQRRQVFETQRLTEPRLLTYTILGIVYLDMLLQILWTLEALSAKVALVWLQWHMDSDV